MSIDTTADLDDENSWMFSNPDSPDTVRHAMPDLDGIVPCCGQSCMSLPDGEWTTAGADRVTCGGAA